MEKAQEPTQKLNTAGFGVRLLALIIDIVILSVLDAVLPGDAPVQEGTTVYIGFSFQNWELLIPAMYFIGFWAWKGATPGKMAMKLKIVNEKGEKISWQMAIVRYVGYIVSMFVLFLGVIWIAIDKQHQGWHDKMAKSYVVKE